MAPSVDQAQREARIRGLRCDTIAPAPGADAEPIPDGRWPTLFPMVACFVGFSGRVPNAFEEPDRFLRAVMELQAQLGWPVYRLTIQNARTFMAETTNRALLGACVECGQIFPIAPRRGAPRKRCSDCADEAQRGVPLHRRRAHLPAAPERVSELRLLCWWCNTYLSESARADAQTCSTRCRAALYRYFESGGWMSRPDPLTGRAEITGQETPARQAAARYRGIPLRPDLA
jgi:hypothetical protein